MHTTIVAVPPRPQPSLSGAVLPSRARRLARAAVLLLGCLGSALAAAATHEIHIVGMSFSPSELTIAPGDTVLWRNQSAGTHNVVADGGQFTSGRPASGLWTFGHTFNSSGEFPFYCNPHGGPGGQGMSGKIIVSGDTTEPAFTINEGIAGSWYQPSTNGQGLLLEASESAGVVVLAWFTWTTAGGGYDWLTGAGAYEGDTATLTLSRSSGGRFDDPAPVSTIAVGSAVLRFTDCTHATFDYELDDPARSGSIALERILPPNPSCLAANPEAAGR